MIRWVLILVAPFTGGRDVVVDGWSTRAACEAGYARIVSGVARANGTGLIANVPHICVEVK